MNEEHVQEESLRQFLLSYVAFNATEPRLKVGELNPKITQEGFAGSFDDALRHLFYKLALSDEFKGLCTQNKDFQNLCFLVDEYQLIWTDIYSEMEGFDFNSQLSFLDSVEETIRYYINEFQLPAVSPEIEMKLFKSEVDTATKYANFSISLAVYAYFSHKFELTELAWIALIKAREMYAYFAAVRSFQLSTINGRTSFKKTKNKSKETFTSIIPFIMLQLKQPPKLGWKGVDETVEILLVRTKAFLKRYRNVDFDEKFLPSIEDSIRIWLEEDKFIREVYFEFSCIDTKLIEGNSYLDFKHYDFKDLVGRALMEPFSPERYSQTTQIFKKSDKVERIKAEEYEELRRLRVEVKLLTEELSKCRNQSLDALLSRSKKD